MITVTYHAISDGEDALLPKSITVSPEQLDEQIDHLGKFHRFPAPGELAASLRDTGVPPSNAAIFTFDDAHVGQATAAAEILERRGVRGFFFAPTCIVNDHVLPTVERQRLLQYSRIEYPAFYDAFCKKLEELCPELDPAAYLPTDRTISSALNYYAEYEFYSPLERLYRKVRETLISPDRFDQIVACMFKERFCEKDIVERHYLSWDHLKQLKDKGHEIGGHGHAHLLETDLDSATATSDVKKCMDLIALNLGAPPLSYAYPYGIFKRETEDFLKRREVIMAFTCRPGIGMDGTPLRMDRLDCQALPFKARADPSTWSLDEIRRSVHHRASAC